MRPSSSSLIVVAAALLVVLGATPLRAQRGFETLRPELERRVAAHDGRAGIALLDPRTGERLGIGADQAFPTASVIKVPILVEVFHQAQLGRLDLDAPLRVLEADKVPGSGVLRYLDAPHVLSVRDAAFLMIALSDNTATNVLIDEVGVRAVNARMDSLGLPGTRLYRKTFEDSSAVAPDSAAVYGLGRTTPMEIARLLALIYRGEAVSAAASEAMLEMLRRQFYGLGLPRYLGDAAVAHKTGEVSASRHDCGIIFADGADYVLCVMTDDNADTSWRVDNDANLLIADVARTVHRHVAGTASRAGAGTSP